jgi:prepilin-type N-terminal cleavage/methylation domain-containing protein
MINSKYKSQKGMTLIELMFTMLIMAVVVSVAVPNMKFLFEGASITDVGKRFEQSIRLAKNQAIKLGEVVRVRPTSTNSDWSQGWFIEYSKVAADGTIAPELLHTYPALPNNITFTNDEGIHVDMLPNGQARANINLVLTNSLNCSFGIINYELLVSGYLQKRIAECP